MPLTLEHLSWRYHKYFIFQKAYKIGPTSKLFAPEVHVISKVGNVASTSKCQGSSHRSRFGPGSPALSQGRSYFWTSWLEGKKGNFKKCTSFLNAPKKHTTYFKYSFFFPPSFFAKIKEKGERSPHLPNATSTFIEYIVVVVAVIVASSLSHSKYVVIGQWLESKSKG